MHDDIGDHMTPAELRQRGRAALEWLCGYLERIESFPVLARVAPGEVRSALPPNPPDAPEPFEDALADLERILLPGITHWQSPNFFGYFPANSTGPAIIGEMLAAGLGIQGMLWITSPASTELEAHVMDWLVDMLGLPERFKTTSTGGGVIQDSASSANLVALVAARERAVKAADGRGMGRPTVYATSQTHSSVEKAVRVAGIGTDNLRIIAVGRDLAMDPSDLERVIEQDLAAGATPVMVAATVGTTSTLAVDPVRALGRVCRRHGAWLHVDAAMAGTAAVCDEHRWINDGVELADSYCFDPHKWMFTTFDCSVFFVADRRALIESMSIEPEYLRNPASASGAVIDYRDWHIPLGRRFRALKLWLVIRHYGVRGIAHHVREHVELAREFASWVRDNDDLELHEPQHLALVCFRHRAGNEATTRLLDAVNDSIFLTHTKVGGLTMLRMSIGQANTRRRHVEAAWNLIREAAAAVGG